MKISILNSDLSGNCLGRAYLLAQVLSHRYKVELIGPIFGDGIWPPCNTGLFEYKAVRGRGYPFFVSAARELLSHLSGDVIYAMKPRMPSYGLALLKRLSKYVPVVLDIDDWETGLFRGKGWLDFLKNSLYNIRIPNSQISTAFAEFMVPLADQVTTASTFLQQRFGGVIVPHGRDTDFLNPVLYNPAKMKAELDLAKHTNYIVFLGSASPHKGLEDLIRAIYLLGRSDLKLLMVGWVSKVLVNGKEPYIDYLKALGGEYIEIRGYCPFSDIPRYLSTATLTVFPQRATTEAIGQVPAKIFDAMAMAKPIISTAVSDIPEILAGCGLVVQPGDVEALAEKIEFVLSNEAEAKAMGQRARQRCIQEYSWQAMDKTLHSIFKEYS